MHGRLDGLFLRLPSKPDSKIRAGGSRLKQHVALSFVLAIALCGLAHAHAKIIPTVPADGDFVASPQSLLLNFDNDVSLTGLGLHTITGVSAEGRTVEGKVVGLVFDPTVVARSIVIEIPETLLPGEYYLLWRCIAADSHFSTGEFFFTVKSD